VSGGVCGIGRYKLSPPTFGCVYALPTVALCGIMIATSQIRILSP
jgi:hypothetical protein